jgi:sensor histidine kinase YesM
MASIQYMIHTKDIYKADNYLTSFGTLVRMILESSKNKTWSVRSEIKMLKLYLELEKERFEDGFIHTEIDTKKLINEDMEIPPMLIQPFVENACNHAFWGLKDKQAELKIIFSEKEDALIVKISDNGVGIEKSKSHSTISYKKSRGMEITQERIDNFNSNNLKQITLKISELYPLKEFPGTLITIIINK